MGEHPQSKETFQQTGGDANKDKRDQRRLNKTFWLPMLHKVPPECSLQDKSMHEPNIVYKNKYPLWHRLEASLPLSDIPEHHFKSEKI